MDTRPILLTALIGLFSFLTNVVFATDLEEEDERPLIIVNSSGSCSQLPSPCSTVLFLGFNAANLEKYIPNQRKLVDEPFWWPSELPEPYLQVTHGDNILTTIPLGDNAFYPIESYNDNQLYNTQFFVPVYFGDYCNNIHAHDLEISLVQRVVLQIPVTKKQQQYVTQIAYWDYPFDLYSDSDQVFSNHVFQETCSSNDANCRTSGRLIPELTVQLCRDDTTVDTPIKNRILSSDDEETVSISPNPFMDRVNITLPFDNQNEDKVELQVLDATGRIVKQRQYNNQHLIDMNVTDLNPGIYFFKVKIGNQVTTKKLVKF